MDNQQRDQIILEKLNSGMSLSDLQKLLADEYGLRMTYFELRMLTTSLKVQWDKQEKPKRVVLQDTRKPAPQPSAPKQQEEALPQENAEIPEEEAEEEPEEAAEPADGTTTVTLDDTPMPGAAMSGTVHFASGATGKWMMDRMGRLGMAELDEKSGEPTDEDYQLFQQELQAIMRRKSEELQKAAFDGRTKVEISPVVRPGCDMNGTVEFASGAKGEWMVAQGKLDFDLEEGSSQPTKEDLGYFQLVLRKKLQEKGFAG